MPLLSKKDSPICVLDNADAILGVNEAFCHLIEFEKEEVEGQSISSFFSAESDLLSPIEFRQIMKNQIAGIRLNRILKTKSGKSVPVQFQVSVHGEFEDNFEIAIGIIAPIFS